MMLLNANNNSTEGVIQRKQSYEILPSYKLTADPSLSQE